MNFIKTIIFMSLISVSTFGADLTKATKLKIVSADGEIDVSALSVHLYVRCLYKKGFIFKEEVSCGKATYNLVVSSFGEVEIPALPKFKGFHGSSIDNYSISIYLSSDFKNVASLFAKGKNQLKNFHLNDKILSIYKIEDSEIYVTKNGKNVLQSELTEHPDASLMARLQVESDESGSTEHISVVSALQNSIWLFDNRKDFESKKLLKDAKEIDLKGGTFATFKTEKPKINLEIIYSHYNIYQSRDIYKNFLKLEVSPDMLKDLGEIEIK